MTIIIKTKTIVLPNAPVQFKKEIGKLLVQLMKDYNIYGTKDNKKVFQLIFKSNLYYIIDNYFDVKKNK